MLKTFAFLVAGVTALVAFASAPAAAMPAAPLTQASPAGFVRVYHEGRPHPRTRVTVYPERYANPYATYPDYSYYYPPARGFDDRSNVRRGNMRGCTVDLGYGRYEPC